MIIFAGYFYKDIEKLNWAQFKRLTGVKREVFEQMPEELKESKPSSRKHPSRGTPARLSNADKLLLLLMYNREYINKRSTFSFTC
jgi:hypothetical protein